MSVPERLEAYIGYAEGIAWANLENAGAVEAIGALTAAIARALVASQIAGITNDQFATALNVMAGPGWDLGVGGTRIKTL